MITSRRSFITRRATSDEELLTIICKHKLDDVITDHGRGRRCSKCMAFFAKDWFSPQTVVAE